MMSTGVMHMAIPESYGSETGTITFRLWVECRQLPLNVDSNGWMRIASTDESGREYPGFGLRDCDLVIVDATEHWVSWEGRCDAPSPEKPCDSDSRCRIPNSTLLSLDADRQTFSANHGRANPIRLN